MTNQVMSVFSRHSQPCSDINWKTSDKLYDLNYFQVFSRDICFPNVDFELNNNGAKPLKPHFLNDTSKKLFPATYRNKMPVFLKSVWCQWYLKLLPVHYLMASMAGLRKHGL